VFGKKFLPEESQLTLWPRIFDKNKIKTFQPVYWGQEKLFDGKKEMKNFVTLSL
jgi:hypothetical protein